MFQILLEVASILLIWWDKGGGHNQECLLNYLCTFQDGYGCCRVTKLQTKSIQSYWIGNVSLKK